MARVPQVTIENPILNSPFEAPGRHFRFDNDGITTDIDEKRRASAFFMPIARARKKGEQAHFDTEWTLDRIRPNTEINRIRERVDRWRQGGYVDVTPTTRRLLAYWGDPSRERKLFFCQREAVEAAIYLAEVASRYGDASIENYLRETNADYNAGLPRIAVKMATGSGKTVVMGMLMAWQALNKLENRGRPLHGCFPDRHTGDHDPRPAARAAADRPGQLLSGARPPPTGPARAAGAGAHHHHELPRLHPARKRGRRASDQIDPGAGRAE